MRIFALSVIALCGLPWEPIAYGGALLMFGTYIWWRAERC